MSESVAVVGAGLAGCLLATLLGRRGMAVTVYERRPDPRLAGAERGRSINLAISARGLAALERVGLRDAALARALPMPGRMVHGLGGAAELSPLQRRRNAGDQFDQPGRTERGVARLRLGDAGCDPAIRAPAHVSGRRRTAIRHAGRICSMSAPTWCWRCDGAYSGVRRALELDAREEFLEHGYKELTIPARDGEFALGSRGIAHLAARLVDDDRAAEPGPVFHVHPVLAEVRVLRARYCRSRHGRVSRAIPRRRRAHAVPRR